MRRGIIRKIGKYLREQGMDDKLAGGKAMDKILRK